MRKLTALLTALLLIFGGAAVAFQPGAITYHYGTIKPPGIPRIDWSNPLTVGLKGYWILNGNAAVRNLVTGEAAVQSGTVTPSPTAAGIGANFHDQEATASNYYTVHTGPILGGSANFSIVTGAILNTNHSCQTNAGEYSIYAERAPTGMDIIKMAYCPGGVLAQSTPVFTYRNDGGTLVQPGSVLSTAYNDNKFHVSVASKHSNVGSNNVILYMDGKPFASANWTTDDHFTDSGILTEIGRDPASTSTGWGNYISFVAIYNVPLTQAQAISISKNPYQFLVFPQDTILSAIATIFNAPSSGGANLFGSFPP